MQTARGGTAAETQQRHGGDLHMRIVQGPGEARGAEALLSARGKARLSALALLGQSCGHGKVGFKVQTYDRWHPVLCLCQLFFGKMELF